MTRRSRPRVSHAREIYYILAIVALVVATLFSIWGPGGYLEMKRAEEDVARRRARVEQLRRSNELRLQNIQALRSDPQTQEKYAREKGYSRGGEIIQQLPQEAPAPPK
jgi:cell division protein FtsB